MELYKELLCKEIGWRTLEAFPDIGDNLAGAADQTALDTLQKIKAVLEDDSLDDFMCVEAIVLVFESTGISVGYRHDFG